MISAKVFVLIFVLCFYESHAFRYFPNGSVWFQDVSNAALDSESSQIIQWLTNAGGWGTQQLRK